MFKIWLFDWSQELGVFFSCGVYVVGRWEFHTFVQQSLLYAVYV
jgi:hypothetical protein